jgi:hypothetical protein
MLLKYDERGTRLCRDCRLNGKLKFEVFWPADFSTIQIRTQPFVINYRGAVFFLCNAINFAIDARGF